MPILNLLITGLTNALGNPSLPHGHALMGRGPVLEVEITVAPAVAKQLAQLGQPIPAPVKGIALIDTGASITCVDDAAVVSMGISPVDVGTISSASHANVSVNIYPIGISILASGLGIEVPRAYGAALAGQGLLVLIGRDVLMYMVMVYNGQTDQITLCF